MGQICSQRLFPVENWNSEHHHQILHTGISLDTWFQFKMTILIFCTKFTQKEYFWSEMEKVKTTTELCEFKLA